MTFTPSQPILAKLATTAQPLIKAVRDIVFGLDMQDFVNYKRAEREHLRPPLLAFERKLEGLRKAVAEKHITPADVAEHYREWVAYDRATFYAQLVRLYQNKGLWSDVTRLKQVFAKGGKHTSTVKDEHGNVVGSETITDTTGEPLNKKSNAVEVEF